MPLTPLGIFLKSSLPRRFWVLLNTFAVGGIGLGSQLSDKHC